MFDSNMFTLLAEAEVGKHFYWNLAGFLVHGQVLAVIWFVVILLLIFAFLGTSNADRIPLTNRCKMVFEVENVNNASPATISRTGIIYVSSNNIGWRPLIDTWC